MRLEDLVSRLVGGPSLAFFLAIFSIAASQTSTDCEFVILEYAIPPCYLQRSHGLGVKDEVKWPKGPQARSQSPLTSNDIIFNKQYPNSRLQRYPGISRDPGIDLQSRSRDF